jgi:hypothetical protein
LLINEERIYIAPGESFAVSDTEAHGPILDHGAYRVDPLGASIWPQSETPPQPASAPNVETVGYSTGDTIHDLAASIAGDGGSSKVPERSALDEFVRDMAREYGPEAGEAARNAATALLEDLAQKMDYYHRNAGAVVRGYLSAASPSSQQEK